MLMNTSTQIHKLFNQAQQMVILTIKFTHFQNQNSKSVFKNFHHQRIHNSVKCNQIQILVHQTGSLFDILCSNLKNCICLTGIVVCFKKGQGKSNFSSVSPKMNLAFLSLCLLILSCWFVHVICFSVLFFCFIFLQLKQTIYCRKMMKQKNQNQNWPKTFLLWLEKKNEQQICFFSFCFLGLPVILTLLSLVFVATSVVTVWPATMIGLCWCECLAKWQYLVAEWSFLYFLEHNSFCFGLFLMLSPDNVLSTRFQSNMNQQHKKMSVWCLSFSSWFFWEAHSSAFKSSILFLTFAFASLVSCSTRTCPTSL